MPRLLPLLLLFVAATLHAEERLYIQSESAKILSEPSFKGKVVTTLQRGQAVSVKGGDARWAQVTTEQNEGWISRFLLAKDPPLDRVTILNEEGEVMEENARRRASAVTTAGAARGLTAEDRSRSSNTSLNYHALDRVEAIKVDPQEVDRFLQ
jgi:hypothetical protein